MIPIVSVLEIKTNDKILLVQHQKYIYELENCQWYTIKKHILAKTFKDLVDKNIQTGDFI